MLVNVSAPGWRRAIVKLVRTFIDQSLVARRRACTPAAEAGLGELRSRVRGRERPEHPLTSSTNELVLDSFRDETAAVPARVLQSVEATA